MSLLAITTFCAGQTHGSLSDNMALSALRGFAVMPSDTIIPTPDTTLRKLYIAGEERNSLKRQVRSLEETVKLLNEAIKELQEKNELAGEFYKNQIASLKEQIAELELQIQELKKEIKREKFKRTVTGLAGIAATGVMIYLSSK